MQEAATGALGPLLAAPEAAPTPLSASSAGGPAPHEEHTLKCGIRLPVEPLWDLKLAAALVPCSYKQLIDHLRFYKDRYPPARYRIGDGRRMHRVLTGAEVIAIRAHMVRVGRRWRRSPISLRPYVPVSERHGQHSQA